MSTATFRKIPMLDLKTQYASLAGEIAEAVRKVLESQALILGPEVKDFEKEIAEYCDCRYAIGCASGSDALLLALMAFGVGHGDEVVTSPFTFFATVGSVVRLGAKPIFVDIDPETFNLDTDQLPSAITDRTKAVIPIHLFGQCAEMDAVNRESARVGARVLEDAAQAIGSKYNGRLAGSIGDVGAFSFYPSKNLGGAGDGGMLTTNDADLASDLRTLAAHGAKRKYYHDMVGINSRLDSLQAAILRVKLNHLAGWAEGRRANAARYGRLFTEIGLVEQGLVQLPLAREGQHHVFNQYVIRVGKRDELRAFLVENGIGTEIYYPVPMHLQKCFSDLGHKEGAFPQSEKAAREVLAIPVYPELDASSQEYIVETISRFYRT